MAELTPRQRQVLCLVTLSGREVGMRLGISHQTVKNLLTDVYQRLGVNSSGNEGKRIPGLLAALDLGIIALDEIELPPQRLPTGWCSERFAQLHTAQWREWKKCTGLTCISGLTG